MSRISKLVRMFTKVAADRPDEVRRGIDRAGRAIDRKTGGRYRSKIERGTHMASRYLEGRGRGGHKRHW